ncbi:MAG TPA: response regulator, partial [Polyangiaceae bacterium]
MTRDSSGESAVQILAPNVLCVDDDPHVLMALRRTLCRHFCVDVAQGGQQGLELMEKKRYAVVIVDMKMPGMSGLEFLRRAREGAPETTRILLTGNSDFESAVVATNVGGIFRFVCKPYNPVEFPSTVASAVHHHHLLVAEKNVAQRTLAGTVDLLVQFASMLAPDVCERLARAQEVARSVSLASGIADSSPLETAALVHVLACATTPTLAPQGSRALIEARSELLGRSQRLSERLLGAIPSSSLVLNLFERARHETLDSPTAALMSPEIMALLLLLEWEALIQAGSNEAAARWILEQREVYPRELLDAL